MTSRPGSPLRHHSKLGCPRLIWQDGLVCVALRLTKRQVALSYPQQSTCHKAHHVHISQEARAPRRHDQGPLQVAGCKVPHPQACGLPEGGEKVEHSHHGPVPSQLLDLHSNSRLAHIERELCQLRLLPEVVYPTAWDDGLVQTKADGEEDACQLSRATFDCPL